MAVDQAAYEQAKNKTSQDRSQDKKDRANSGQYADNNQSQDAPQNLSIADGVTKFYETRCEFYENVFMQADQQAAKDVMGKFLTYDKGSREAVGGDFFGNLATKRQALSFGLLPSLFLPEAAEADPMQELCDRHDYLANLEELGNINEEEAKELELLHAQLKEAGRIK